MVTDMVADMVRNRSPVRHGPPAVTARRRRRGRGRAHTGRRPVSRPAERARP